jgi:hypothetical protein
MRAIKVLCIRDSVGMAQSFPAQQKAFKVGAGENVVSSRVLIAEEQDDAIK